MGSVRPPSVVPLEERTERFLTSPDGLPIHDFRYCQEYVAPAVNYADLLATERSPVATMLQVSIRRAAGDRPAEQCSHGARRTRWSVDHLTCHDQFYDVSAQKYFYWTSSRTRQIQVDRDPTTGRVLTFSEVPIDAAELGRTAHNSSRSAGRPARRSRTCVEDVANFPFWPGGSLEAPPPPPAEYLTTAPGLSEGLSLPSLTDQLDSTPAAAPVSSGPEPEPAELGYDWVWQRPEGEQPAAETAEWDREAAAAADRADGEQQAAELEAALKVTGAEGEEAGVVMGKVLGGTEKEGSRGGGGYRGLSTLLEVCAELFRRIRVIKRMYGFLAFIFRALSNFFCLSF
ncbi:hypothetical protein FJT64_025807 [Amphibalanus amphitrite]|uniref:Ski2 N-terminal domain-containing protein n=1 Tax=Amphibalanus amphitrite TaxID=1232801 RepID=A0A6A4WE30_AMPAM|nr:hypothetical protein FJT64_025807 [Amphibalanus amphitrite]KAF0302095.1 hypothetical protein FJT64_025807 [Amphibalanus amphitrite]